MRFGLVGAGEIGRLRAAALRALPGCRLAAVSDRDLARAQAAAGGAAVFEDYRLMLEQTELDAVIVSAPPERHEEVATAALEAGRHVLCEKPLAPSVEACCRMLQTARERGRCLATGFNQRYFPAIQFVKTTVESGAIGRLNHVRAYAGHRGLPEFRDASQYAHDSLGGGTLMDNGIHLIDHVRFLLGEVTEVWGAARGDVWQLPGSEDNGFALLAAPDGAIATLHSSWTEWRGYRFSVDAYGDRGMARAVYGPMFSMAVYLDRPGGSSRRKYNLYPWVTVREKLGGWQATVRAAFREELGDFVKFVAGKPASIADGVAGYRAVEIAQAVYTSTKSRAAVKLAEPL